MGDRPLLLGSISTADGSSLVRLGDTTVVCGVKAEIAEPDLDAPEDGFLGIAPTGPDTENLLRPFLVPNLDLSPLCSPKYKPGPPSDDAQVLSSRLNEALILYGISSTTPHEFRSFSYCLAQKFCPQTHCVYSRGNSSGYCMLMQRVSTTTAMCLTPLCWPWLPL